MSDVIPDAAPVTDATTSTQAEPVADTGSLLSQIADQVPDVVAQPAADAQPGEKDPAAAGDKPVLQAPEVYEDFKLPEGVTFDEGALESFKGMAKELNIPQDKAQALVDLVGPKIAEQMQAPYKAWTETQAKWTEEVKADPEFGGADFKEKIGMAIAPIFQPGPSNPICKTAADVKELKQALSFTGAGNNPAVVRAFARLGRAMSEPGAFSGRPINSGQKFVDQMYPSMAVKE